MAELARLMDLHLDGCISADQHERLVAMLRSDQRYAQAYARRSIVHYRLRELLTVEHSESLLAGWDDDEESMLALISSLEDTNHDMRLVDVTERQAREPSQTKPKTPTQGPHRSPDDERQPVVIVISKPLLYAAAIAAAALIAVVLYPYFESPNAPDESPVVQDPTQGPEGQQPTPAPIVASLTESYRPVWAAGSAAALVGEGMQAGLYELKAGALTVTFDRGAAVLIQAPARFELIDDNRGRVEFGRITAVVPPQAMHFTIDTPTAQVMDFGTEFGVSVDKDGGTLAAVFSGLVELSERPSENNPEPAKIAIKPGLQAVVDTETGLSVAPEPLAVNHVFARDMVEARYRPQIAGQGEYLRETPQSLAIGRVTDPHRMRIVRERVGVRLQQRLNGVLTRPGAFTGKQLRDSMNGRVASGKRVDCYLVHFDPGLWQKQADPGNAPQQPPAATATFDFDRPVVAVIADGNLLYETDRLFALPLMDLPLRSDFPGPADQATGQPIGNGRGVEFTNSDDRIEISEDRRRVTLTLAASITDQVRILTEPAD